MKTREVTLCINRKHEAVLSSFSGEKQKYSMEPPVFDRLKEILEQNSKKLEQSQEVLESKVEKLSQEIGALSDLLKTQLKLKDKHDIVA